MEMFQWHWRSGDGIVDGCVSQSLAWSSDQLRKFCFLQIDLRFMTKKTAAIFWISLVSGLGGIAAAYFLLASPVVEIGAAERVQIDEEEASLDTETSPVDAGPESDEGSVEALAVLKTWVDGVPPGVGLGMILLGLVGFWAAWHGGMISTAPETPVTGAIAGLVSALFIWSAFALPIPALCWFLLQPFPPELGDLALFSAAASLLGWQFGFWAARPWAVKTVSLDAH